MLKKILLALDGSENAQKALPWAKELARREKALVVLCRVLLRHGDWEQWKLEREEAREDLRRMERELNFAGVPAKILIRRGKPPQEIAAVAREEGCDLILMATRGGSRVKRWALGGVTEQVLRLSEIPVLPIRSQVALPRQGHVRRVIVPVDGSRLAESPVSFSVRLARLFKARLIFLHVDPAEPGRGPRRHAKSCQALHDRLTRLSAALARQGVKASLHLQKGDPADRIIQFADQNDLILTSTHGYGGFKRWVFGSVAEKLIHQAGTPVLVFKRPA